MAIGKSEWILRDAVAAVVDGEVKDLEAYAMPEDYVPSMRFQDKIKMLNSRNKRRTLKRIGVKVACAVLVFLLLDFGHYIATGTEAIASVLKLISKDQPGGFVGYEIKGDKLYVTTGMSVGYVPEGYSCDHVFVNQSLGDIDYVKKDGEKISIAGADGVMDIVDRMSDVKRRYGSYDQEKWDANIALKENFEKRMGRDLYEAVEKETFKPQIK